MNRKYFFIYFIIALVSGCSQNNPKTVAQKFLSASARMNYDEAKKYATPATAKLLDMLSATAEMTPDSVKKKRDSNFEIIREYGRNDTLSVILYHVKNSDSDQTLNVVKRDGKWLVNVSKEEFNNREIDL